jgi:predicted RND superfamily exporter protein
MGYFASQIKLSYEFTKAIPENNEKYIIYKKFVKQFGVDGTTMVIGFQTDKLYTSSVFNAMQDLQVSIKSIAGVTEVLGVPSAYNIIKDSVASKFNVQKIFNTPYINDSALLADKNKFEQLPFYKNLLYNPDSSSYVLLNHLKLNLPYSNKKLNLICMLAGFLILEPY